MYCVMKDYVFLKF